MKAIIRESLTERYHWAVPGLLITFTLFGLVSFIGQRILSTMILTGKMDLTSYQGALFIFQLVVGILASVSLAVFFVFAVLGTVGLRRAGFIAGSVSSIAPVFGALSTTILFQVFQLPSMGAGSVIASAVTAVLMALPCFIMMILFAFCKRLTPGSRFAGMFVAVIFLVVALLPVVIAVLALVVMPGNPAMRPLMQLSPYLIHIRPLLIALSIGLVFYMNKKNIA
ncbi:MAG: hypothetical protein GX024_05395 [Clostridiales bacterium]|jgi:hypothetical protein|nr:hypothetical protein [Clostridiales bacterium]